MEAQIEDAGNDPLLTRNEAAGLLKVSPATLAAWQMTGRYGLKTVKIGRLVRYRLSTLKQWLRDREGAAEPVTAAVAAVG